MLFGPTGGFLFGYILCALTTGMLTGRLGFTRTALMLSMAAGTAACYLPGMAWFSLTTGASLAESLGVCVLPFIPGDILKAVLAASLSMRLRKPLRSAGLCV